MVIKVDKDNPVAFSQPIYVLILYMFETHPQAPAQGYGHPNCQHKNETWPEQTLVKAVVDVDAKLSSTRS